MIKRLRTLLWLCNHEREEGKKVEREATKYSGRILYIREDDQKLIGSVTYILRCKHCWKMKKYTF